MFYVGILNVCTALLPLRSHVRALNNSHHGKKTHLGSHLAATVAWIDVGCRVPNLSNQSINQSIMGF